MKKYLTALFIIATLFSYNIFANKEVAITIDDLPFLGKADNAGKIRREKERFEKSLAAIEAEHIPVTGFVISDTIEPGQWELLEKFRNTGNIIGNHTANHINFNSTSATRFIASIAKADQALAPLMSQPKYFRFPFLATGRNCKDYDAVANYLKTHDYVVVPVTIDSKDFQLNYRFSEMPWRQRKTSIEYYRQAYMKDLTRRIKNAEHKTMQLAHRPIKQIFLIHMNMLNAEYLPDVIKLFREQGYRFITVSEAMQDPFYKTFEQRCNNSTSATG